MTDRGSNTAKRTLPAGSGVVAAATPLPLFDASELTKAQIYRAELLHKLAHHRMDAHSRIRTQQKLKLIVAKIMRLELQLGGKQ